MFNDEYNFHVDTQPMANKLDTVSNKVNQTTGAVVAMESAVIATEKQSARQISEKLDVGFFNVVMSQIAQKVANERAKSAALAMELMQQQKALQNLQARMTNDYNMISARYSKLFNSLNQELKNRITDLDKPLMDYCSQHVKKLENRIYGLVSDVPVYQSESLTASQSIAAAHMKSNAQQLISAATNYLTNDKEQRNKSEDLQMSAHEAEVYYVPVIIDEETTETRQNGTTMKLNPTLQAQMSEHAYQQIAQQVNNSLDTLTWKDNPTKGQQVYNTYLSMVENANMPKRMKDIMLKLSNIRFGTL